MTTDLTGPEVDLADSPFSDFLGFELLLGDQDRELLSQVRAFMTREVEPVINEHWTRAEFPHELVPGLAELGIAGLAYDGPGCPARGALVDGMVAMELSRIDPSIGTFMGVHGGLAMGSIQLCGSPEQRERWLPAMARMELIGAFGLTEPEVGSAIAGGLATTATRDGDAWVLNGDKKWIGNASFADLIIIWARDTDDGQVKASSSRRTPRAWRSSCSGTRSLCASCRTPRSTCTTSACRRRTGCRRPRPSRTPPTCCG